MRSRREALRMMEERAEELHQAYLRYLKVGVDPNIAAGVSARSAGVDDAIDILRGKK